MVDRALVAAKIAGVRDATERVRAVRAREVVTLNLLVAVQGCLDLAAHWLADAGWEVPATYGEVFCRAGPS